MPVPADDATVPTIDVQSGEIDNGPLVAGGAFQWVNYSNQQVTLTNCGNWCTADSYTIPAGSEDAPSYTAAQLRNVPNNMSYAFTDPAWNAGGMPHVQGPTVEIRVERDKDAA